MKERSEIVRAAKEIRAGRLVAFPTETVYGLGADVFNSDAIARIFEVKQRPHFDPLIVHVATLNELRHLVRRVPAGLDEMIARFWPGPLTMVFPKKEVVPDIVTAGLDSVAVRWPSHPIALELIRLAGTPVAAPSANLFGKLSPTTANHVREQLGDSVDMILDGGRCGVGIESTIISFTGSHPILLRHGGYSREEIEEIVGPIECASSNDSAPNAPGMLKKHYAPHTPVAFCDGYEGDDGRVGILSFRGVSESRRYAAVEVLSADGDLREAAANLFTALRQLDKANLDMILVERVPDECLGRAINDRLERACAAFLRDKSVRVEI